MESSKSSKKQDFKGIAESKVEQKKAVQDESSEDIVSNELKRDHRIMVLPVEQIQDNPHQPRRNFDETALNDLAASIKTHGLLNPILVEAKDGEYTLVGGERRLRACKNLGHETIRAILITADPEVVSIIDNLQREDLHPMERSLAVRKLYEKYDNSAQRVAEVISTSENTVQRLLKLSSLPVRIAEVTEDSDIEKRITNNRIPLREFYELMRIEDNTALVQRFEQMERKYSKVPTVEPIRRRAVKVQDELDKCLTLVKKIGLEISAIEDKKEDKRLDTLRQELEEILHKIVEMQSSILVSD
ncbi:MAG: ParB/RepB/Spo0J family partition protein [Saccharofermentanales bacterium]|jgi:ParB family chromosome partitioning protein